MKSTCVIGLILLAGMGATAANAGVLYDFSGVGGSTQSVSFQIMLPNFLNPPVGGQAVTFACSALNTSVNCDAQQTWGVFFSVGLWGAGAGYVDTILFQSSNNSAYWFYFQSGSFDNAGTYLARSDGQFNPGTLVVAPTGAPEPGSIFLALTGCLLLVAYRFKRRAA